ncbi:hypothetical protein CDCA_CDCA06G1857 [Cyanidium caldarium]|uniref:Coiled-coil domain-containing protein 86 n=1 Tax=Cyanidium caldarium TaxID=2771 RepID=A0AAV9IU36_CYACA|nr:hypothetical protein CDCA_CDCA06G1857 [Cyanidium caldarium]
MEADEATAAANVKELNHPGNAFPLRFPQVGKGKRPWRAPRTRRSSACVQKSSGQRRSWADKTAERERLEEIKRMERELLDKVREQRRAEHERVAERRRQREENALRTGTSYQVITNNSKLKKMTKRQLKMLRKGLPPPASAGAPRK